VNVRLALTGLVLAVLVGAVFGGIRGGVLYASRVVGRA
jgi:hypothetical protein